MNLNILALLFFILSFSLGGVSSRANAHAWRGQAVVLFITYEVRPDEIRGTLGLPGALLLREFTSRPSTLRSLLRDKDGYTELVRTLQTILKRDLPVQIDHHDDTPHLTRVDVILSMPRSRDPELRDIRVIEGVNVETHSGQPEALVVNFSVPLKRAPREIRYLWKSERWFVREGRRGKRRRQLNTRRVSGIIIDRAKITPISFTPLEPEVIWRSPDALSPPKRTGQMSQATRVQGREEVGRSRVNERRVLGGDVESSLEKSSPETRTFHTLHAQIYSAFNYSTDEEIYDALGLALTGQTLDEVFASTYRALVLRDEGGARAQVTHLIPRAHKVITADDLSPKDRAKLSKRSPTSRAQYIAKHSWRVVGEVTHWGHTHRRVYDYEAIYAMSETDRGWRIVFTSPLSQTRRPELEGGL